MKRRDESFFGLHFDFHATPEKAKGKPIGGTLREEEIREICQLLRPDFLQIDCKGHPGWASYPTQCGNAMPDFCGDPLEKWRRVTREEDVALYMHYSGVIDEKYAKAHPEAAVMDENGKRSTNVTRPQGPYADDLLIPQMEELAGKYGVNGIWVDGECWGSQVDYDPETINAFERETGISLQGRKPVKREDPWYNEYRDYCRSQFKKYVARYVDIVHSRYPDFQIASNWAYTDHMPEAVTSNVDFVSGDLNPWDSFNSARYAGRAIASQGKTWDLMSWNFRSGIANRNGHVVKHPVQIMQEAAAVTALGGGFQNYITQYPDGSPRMEQIRAMKPVADFMRARQPYCFRGKAIHQVVILLSTWDRNRESASLYSRNGNEKIMGLTSLLCDNGQSVEIAEEHTLRANHYEYPVIIIPETFEGLADETIRELLNYAEKGGNLILCGANTCRIFAKAGAPFEIGAAQSDERFFTLGGETYGGCYDSVSVDAPDGRKFAEACASVREEHWSIAAEASFGKGKIVCVGFDLGSAYQNSAMYLHGRLIREILKDLYLPLVTVESAEGCVEIVDLEKNGRMMIQLVNANGAHRDHSVATEDRIQSCRDIRLSIRPEHKPEKLVLQPEGKELMFEWNDGTASVTLPKLEIHEVIEVVG